MNTSTLETITGAERPARARAAVAAAAGFAGFAGFEVALALGAPLGRAAWGGTHVYLPAGLRIASGAAALIWALASLVVLRRGGFQIPVIPLRMARAGTWVLAGLLTAGTLMNAASSSHWERFLQAPIALGLAILCLAVARGPAPLRTGDSQPDPTAARRWPETS
jgi:hypothetical protein